MRPRLTPAIADLRRAVREALAVLGAASGVGASGALADVAGADASGAGDVDVADPSRMRPRAANAPARPGAIDANGRSDATVPDAGGRNRVGGPDAGERDAGGRSHLAGRLPHADVLVALSGGPDSLALAAATAFEAPRAGLRAGAVIVDHGLQDSSADVAARAAAQARELGLDPVLVRRVDVGTAGGPEAAARDARYAALAAAASETGARAVLLGHTLDDQAETVLLGLARGSGAGSLSGMAAMSAMSLDIRPSTSQRPPATNAPARPGAFAANGRNYPGASGASDANGRNHPGASGASDANGRNHPGASGASDANGRNHPGASGASDANGRNPAPTLTPTFAPAPAGQLAYLRPLLGIRREQTLQFCADSGLEPWHDPQNADPAFARVRVRDSVLPLLERELGPGIAEALARTAELSREDSEALDHFAQEQAEELADHAEAGLSLSVAGLANNPAALRQRIIRLAVSAEFGVSLSRTQTLAVARLVTDWRGQGELHLPGIRVVRQGGLLVFSAAEISGEPRATLSEGTPPA